MPGPLGRGPGSRWQGMDAPLCFALGQRTVHGPSALRGQQREWGRVLGVPSLDLRDCMFPEHPSTMWWSGWKDRLIFPGFYYRWFVILLYWGDSCMASSLFWCAWLNVVVNIFSANQVNACTLPCLSQLFQCFSKCGPWTTISIRIPEERGMRGLLNMQMLGFIQNHWSKSSGDEPRTLNLSKFPGDSQVI